MCCGTQFRTRSLPQGYGWTYHRYRRTKATTKKTDMRAIAIHARREVTFTGFSLLVPTAQPSMTAKEYRWKPIREWGER